VLLLSVVFPVYRDCTTQRRRAQGKDVKANLRIVVGSATQGESISHPPIAAHVAFNVGGVVGGIAYMIANAVVTGKAPTPPG
jgi:hypothetical protein